MLLKHKPNATLKDLHRKTPLHLAVEAGKSKVIDLLAKAGMSAVFDRDDCLRTPLHYAALFKRR